jgi:Cu2+-exporting ATPase
MVLVAVAIGAGWLYSVAVTFWIEGEVFYEAAAFLAAFVLLGHWFEMRARGGANDAVRERIATIEAKKSLLNKRVMITLDDGQVHTIDNGAMSVCKILAALDKA